MTLTETIAELKSLISKDHYEKLSHFGINDSKAMGIRVPDIRKLAKKIGIDHNLALELWATKIHEARLLAGMIENPKTLSESQIDEWVYDFDSWDLCDISCDMIGKTPYVYKKIEEYSTKDEEFVKRTSFVLMCELAFYEKNTDNEQFYRYFEIIEQEAWDERNFVKKAVNWALRQIGKRNLLLRDKALETAERIKLQNSKSAQWIANDAIRELKDEKIIARIKKSKYN